MKKKFNKLMTKAYVKCSSKLTSLNNDAEGSAYVPQLILIIIAVVFGTLLLTVGKKAFIEILNDVIAKVKEMFNL